MTSKKVMLSAVQPTNRLTIGNYLGALKNWVGLQHEYSCLFFAVDMHAITVKHDPKQLAENTLFAAATYLAAGIDLKHALVFPQSQVRQHAELAWILNCHGYMGELSRMTQYKDKSAKAGESIPVGLFTYPILMAADILLYQTELVPVGADQKQHLELTRDLAMRMNNLYGPIFKIPEPYIAKVGGKIMDLQDPTAKMSKSAVNEMGTIFLSDDPKEIEKKFKRAVTDSGTEISYADDKPGIRNLIDIQSTITGKTAQQIVDSYVGKMYGHLKVDTAQIVIEELKPIQERTKQIMADRGELIRMLRDCSEQASALAEKTLSKVKDAVGFISLH